MNTLLVCWYSAGIWIWYFVTLMDRMQLISRQWSLTAPRKKYVDIDCGEDIDRQIATKHMT